MLTDLLHKTEKKSAAAKGNGQLCHNLVEVCAPTPCSVLPLHACSVAHRHTMTPTASYTAHTIAGQDFDRSFDRSMPSSANRTVSTIHPVKRRLQRCCQRFMHRREALV